MLAQITVANFIEADVKIEMTEGLAYVDIACGGRLGGEVDRLREAGAVHVDVQVARISGAFFVLLNGVSESYEVCSGSSFLVIDEGDIDGDARRALANVFVACVRERVERERRQVELRTGATTAKPHAYLIGASAPRRKGRFNSP